MSHKNAPLFRMIALTALLGTLAIGPAFATATTNITSGTPANASAPASNSYGDKNTSEDANGSMQTSSSSSQISNHMSAHVEQRIKTLHAKLKITPAQETEWSDVAQAMRDNETNISQLIEDRHQNSKTMNAIEDLQSYQKITQAHADGLAKLIPAFQTLYNDMSDAQQKNADQVFGSFEGHRGMGASKHLVSSKHSATHMNSNSNTSNQ